MQIDMIDPRMEKLAEVGLADSKYQLMIYHTEHETKDKYVEKDSELKKKGSVRKHLGIFQCKSGAKLLVRNSEEVVIPQQARKEVLTELHSTHLCSDGMKRLQEENSTGPGCQRTLKGFTWSVKGVKRILGPNLM